LVRRARGSGGPETARAQASLVGASNRACPLAPAIGTIVGARPALARAKRTEAFSPGQLVRRTDHVPVPSVLRRSRTVARFVGWSSTAAGTQPGSDFERPGCHRPRLSHDGGEGLGPLDLAWSVARWGQVELWLAVWCLSAALSVSGSQRLRGKPSVGWFGILFVSRWSDVVEDVSQLSGESPVFEPLDDVGSRPCLLALAPLSTHSV
jgi:hypothetical protein